MSDFLNRSFSRREKVLMLVLALVLVAGLYFLLVHYPVSQRMDEIELENEEILFEKDVADSRLAVYNDMKAELDEIFAMPEDEITVMPEFDNIQTLMNIFNDIFQGTGQTLNFDNVTYNGNIASRTMRFSFSAADYAQAKSILERLTGTGFRCLMDSVSFAPTEDGSVESGALRVSGTITFYELDKNPPVTETDTAAAEE